MIRILILGTGSMANTHANAFKAEKGVKLVAAVETHDERRAAFAKAHGIERTFASLDEAIAWGGFDAASNVTPDAVHHPTTMKLIAARKHVLCEKPLAPAYPLAKQMADAAEEAGIINMVNLTYRASPALQKARALVEAGKIGQLRHIEADYLQSWLVGSHWGRWDKEDRWLWRLSTKHGSKGTVGDIGIHVVDFATYAAGSDIAWLSAMVKTFHKAKGDRIGGYRLDANDAFAMTVELKNGAVGTIQATRFATGNANDIRVQLYGDKGALRIFTNGGTSSLEMCSGKDINTQVWKPVACPKVPTTYQRFVKALKSGVNGDPDFRRAANIQRVLDALLANGEKRAGAVKVG